MGTLKSNTPLEQMLRHGEDTLSLYHKITEQTKNYGVQVATNTICIGGGALVGMIRMYEKLRYKR